MVRSSSAFRQKSKVRLDNRHDRLGSLRVDNYLGTGGEVAATWGSC